MANKKKVIKRKAVVVPKNIVEAEKFVLEIRKTEKSIEFIENHCNEEIKKLEQKIDFEKNYCFFSCKKTCSSFPFEVAAEYQFRCPACGETMASFDYSKKLENINKQIEELKEETMALKKLA